MVTDYSAFRSSFGRMWLFFYPISVSLWARFHVLPKLLWAKPGHQLMSLWSGSFGYIPDVRPNRKDAPRGGGGGICVCHDMGMRHYLGYFFGVLPDFWVPFWLIPRFLGIIFLWNLICLGIMQIFGYWFWYSVDDIVEYCLHGSCFVFSSVRFNLFL